MSFLELTIMLDITKIWEEDLTIIDLIILIYLDIEINMKILIIKDG